MTLNRTVRLLVALGVVSSACGSRTPSSPTQAGVLNAAGAWHGTLRATSLSGQCSSTLQYIVGGTSQFDVTLTQNGSTVEGTIELTDGTCDVAGRAGQDTLALATTACRPRDRTINFVVCDAVGSELIVRAFAADAYLSAAGLAGSYTYTDEVIVPVGGSVAGLLIENGSLTMTRRSASSFEPPAR